MTADRYQPYAHLYHTEKGPDQPVPLLPQRELLHFPIDTLPAWVADMVRSVAATTQTPVDLAGGIALACLSTAVRGNLEVHVRSGWTELVTVWVIVAARSGERLTRSHTRSCRW